MTFSTRSTLLFLCLMSPIPQLTAMNSEQPAADAETRLFGLLTIQDNYTPEKAHHTIKGKTYADDDFKNEGALQTSTFDTSSNESITTHTPPSQPPREDAHHTQTETTPQIPQQPPRQETADSTPANDSLLSLIAPGFPIDRTKFYDAPLTKRQRTCPKRKSWGEGFSFPTETTIAATFLIRSIARKRAAKPQATLIFDTQADLPLTRFIAAAAHRIQPNTTIHTESGACAHNEECSIQ